VKTMDGWKDPVGMEEPETSFVFSCARIQARNAGSFLPRGEVHCILSGTTLNRYGWYSSLHNAP